MTHVCCRHGPSSVLVWMTPQLAANQTLAYASGANKGKVLAAVTEGVFSSYTVQLGDAVVAAPFFKLVTAAGPARAIPRVNGRKWRLFSMHRPSLVFFLGNMFGRHTHRCWGWMTRRKRRRTVAGGGAFCKKRQKGPPQPCVR